MAATRILRGAGLAALLIAPGFPQKLEIDLVTATVVKSRLESGAVEHRQRQAVIRDLFAEAGCPVEEQKIDKSSGNVVCTLTGLTSATIVVGGHFDFANHGKGIVDDWSGVSLLPSLYQSLKSRPRQHTYVFVAFTGEERGLVGSSRFVNGLTPEQKSLTRAFINLECLGLTPVKVWVSRSAPALVRHLNLVANSVGIELQGMNVDNVGDDDTHSFLRAKIPVIPIHSVTSETLSILHSERGQLDAIYFDLFYDAFRLVGYYLAYLDIKLAATE